MNRSLLLLLPLLFLLGCAPEAPEVKYFPAEEEEEEVPNDWFYRQRAYPDGVVLPQRYHQAVRQELRQRRKSATRSPQANWQFQGPMNVGGRITALDVHPDFPNTIWVGAASGGVFRSDDRGSQFLPLFDDQPTLAVGDLDIAPSQPSTVYVGTGESNAGAGTMAYDGLGIYKTEDNGETWQHLGLEESGSIGRIEVHPQDPGRVYAAAMGYLFEHNPQRGVFRTQDGGGSWEQVLYLNDSTGAVDLVLHPEHPDTIYAAMWERIRRPGYYYYGGLSSGIYRSYDGGDSWEKLDNGLPQGPIGRIGLALSPAAPNIIYAQFIDPVGHLMEIYRSEDGGDSWAVAGSTGINSPGFLWWFGRLFPHPTDTETVFYPNIALFRTQNGGDNWQKVSDGVHVDQHDLYIDPNNPDYLVLGNDGGLYISEDGAESWEHQKSLPITQFYTSEIDYSDPQRCYGGTQDNGTQRTTTGGTDDWLKILLGDGFRCLVDPTDNRYVYASSQVGRLRRSTNGGTSFSLSLAGIPSSERRNWSTPYCFNPLNPKSLYYGTNRLYKSTNRAVFWEAISPNLAGEEPDANLAFGTLTSIAVSPVDTQLIVIGTDNGRVWRTEDGGANWSAVDAGLPQRWVTRVACSPEERETAYVTFSGYQQNEYLPHVFKTTDGGQSWTDISGGLPELPVNEIIADPDAPEHLYLSHDAGVFVSYNGGGSWQSIGQGLPPVIVSDLTLHSPSQTLFAGTYGRSMYRLPLAQLPGPAAPLPGQVLRPNGSAVPGASVSLTPAFNEMIKTDSEGQFVLPGLAAGEDYSLQLSRPDAAANGISNFDILIVFQHLLGINPFDSPYDYLAADVNNSQSISTLDIIGMQRIILGMDTTFINPKRWHFLPEGYTFPDPTDPWSPPFPEGQDLPNLPAAPAEQRFIGVKVGDLNMDANL